MAKKKGVEVIQCLCSLKIPIDDFDFLIKHVAIFHSDFFKQCLHEEGKRQHGCVKKK